jgi:hypothetical protein
MGRGLPALYRTDVTKQGVKKMAHVITIPAVNKTQRNETMFSERDFLLLVDEYMGMEARHYLEELIEDYKAEIKEVLGDDYESVADGYRNELVSTMNALKEELDKPRLNRKNVERIYKDLHRNL